MFSFISLHHSVYRRGSHVNITHDALDLTVQPQQISNLGRPGPSPFWASDVGPRATSKQHQTWDPSVLVKSGDHWLLAQTCSFGDPPEWRLAVATKTEAHKFGFQASGMHPTGMLSCFKIYCASEPKFHFRIFWQSTGLSLVENLHSLHWQAHTSG